jgi:nascent polypeptide-associated complex subunit beta
MACQSQSFHSLTFKIIVQFSARENLLIVTGSFETKELKDMLPDIIKQVGPQQYEALKSLVGGMGKDAKADEDDEDDVPPLVEGTNFESAAKK